MSTWLAGSFLDRVEEARSDPNRVRELWSDPSAVLLGAGDAHVAADASGLVTDPTGGDYDPQRHYLLGLAAGRPWFAAEATAGLVPLRSVMDGLSEAALQVAFTAAGLVGWHLRSRFCSICGVTTEVVAAGMARRCVGCGRELYPRTDPAVIVAILDADDRLLLGRQPSWPAGRHSVFAGFVEMGESLEQAVHREMAEEVGLSLASVTYLGSQPWPFPRSLMVGFVARAEQPAFRLTGTEIEQARWFTRDELRAALAGEVTLPYLSSIARRMIEAWLAGRLAPGSALDLG
ncbi:MAG: NAD(+) diphosphatase [Propionicimonas sp.]